MTDGPDGAAPATGTTGTPAATAAGTPAEGTLASLVTTETPPAVAPPASAPPAGDPPAGEPPAGDKKVEPPAPPVVPEKYELKLPDTPSIEPAAVERTAAIARELGLSQDNAQKTLDFVNSEVAAQIEAVTSAHQPGGAEWTKNVEGWKSAALADAELGGGGKPEVLAANATLADRVLAAYFPPSVSKLLIDSGFGVEPDVLRGFVKIGRAMSEGSLVTAAPAATGAATPEEKLSKMYPTMDKKD